MNDKHIKVATKKMMAYPKNDKYVDNYELYNCLHCAEEYLSQGILESEEEFCPKHTNFIYCVECDVTANKSSMKKLNENEWLCSKCFVPRCSQCNEPIESESSSAELRCKQCYNDYWEDIMEDEYNDM